MGKKPLFIFAFLFLITIVFLISAPSFLLAFLFHITIVFLICAPSFLLVFLFLITPSYFSLLSCSTGIGGGEEFLMEIRGKRRGGEFLTEIGGRGGGEEKV